MLNLQDLSLANLKVVQDHSVCDLMLTTVERDLRALGEHLIGWTRQERSQSHGDITRDALRRLLFGFL
jgi:hypothetical protein